MKFRRIFIVLLSSLAVSSPAFAANWGGLEKGRCDAVSGKRIYKAKLKRNFGDDPAAGLCARLQKTVNGKSRVPDQCVKRGLNGYSGVWLVDDTTCKKDEAKAENKNSVD